jgi:hypothetical protein
LTKLLLEFNSPDVGRVLADRVGRWLLISVIKQLSALEAIKITGKFRAEIVYYRYSRGKEARSLHRQLFSKKDYPSY